MNSFTVVIEPDEDAYHAFVPALPGCHTFGETVDEVLMFIKEAIALYIEGLIENGQPVPAEPEPFLVTRVPTPV
ncbi:MAG TPA: type II toxin-antitoxin system HicB family antitoxin [Chromatiaceae bacterium]|nr:type II toxin-antitoxin system HicB family antitoxin [Chromatiaceae bacterium]